MFGRTPLTSFECIEELDAELARASRNGGALRLGLGMGLEALAERSGHHEMGFSSLEAYALERCERSARWVQESRSLARRLSELPEIRHALLSGRLSWSMASVVASEAKREDEDAWLAKARNRTVREMLELVKEHRGQAVSPAKSAPTIAPAASTLDADEEFCALTVTVDREEAWLFECVRMMVRHLSGARALDDVLEALLAEGFSTLCRWVPREATTGPDEDPANAAQRAWEAELARWREQAEGMCEGRIRERERRDRHDEESSLVLDFQFDSNIEQIDRKLRHIAMELATRDAAIGRLAERFWLSDGWRRLGYATESQYARERLGMSLSAVKAKRRLARQLAKMPRLARAVGEGAIGYEAARLVAEVATPETVDEWVERAAERTVRCLRDEVESGEMLARVAGDGAVDPPSEEVMSDLERVESEVVSGAAFAGQSARRAATANETGQSGGDVGQISAPSPEARKRVLPRAVGTLGRVTLRLRVREGTRRFYRWLERLFGRYRRARVSFFFFLCRAFIETWKGARGSDVQYASVYARDRYRCTCPVCGRRDVTPHHLKFRSRGGADTDENISSLCTWCHLEGIHGGRLAAKPPASSIRWSIGRTPHTVVERRRRIRSPETSYSSSTL